MAPHAQQAYGEADVGQILNSNEYEDKKIFFWKEMQEACRMAGGGLCLGEYMDLRAGYGKTHHPLRG